MLLASICAAAKAHGMVPRPETRREREQRRSRAWRRRYGRDGCKKLNARHVTAEHAEQIRLDRAGSKVSTPGSRTVLRGGTKDPLSQDRRDEQPDAGERAQARLTVNAALRRMDALQRACPPTARAALIALRRVNCSTEGEFAALVADAGPAVPAVAVALAGWGFWLPEVAVLPEMGPKLSARAVGQLERSSAQLDRLFARQGVGVEVVVDELLSWRRAELFDRHRDLSVPRILDASGRDVVSLNALVRHVKATARAAVTRWRQVTPRPEGSKRNRPWSPPAVDGREGRRADGRGRHRPVPGTWRSLNDPSLPKRRPPWADDSTGGRRG